MSQDFSLRYPLIDTHGNNGSLMHNNDYAADRYLEMRSGKIADEMTRLLPKETIDKWKLNYTEEEEYPTYLPTTFPNLLVNGNFGIGVSLASSIPSHNLNDVSEALIKLVDNPNAPFEDLYCPIDFPTGGIIINENDVKESLKNGFGKAAIVRAVVDFDSDNNELIVRELPYMVFSSNATESIQAAIDEGKVGGIESVFDGTDYDGVKIVIKLSKGVSYERVLKQLYKHTMLQSSFSINMNALELGKFPKMFGWVDLMESYINHLKNIMRKSFEFDLKQVKARIHILDGLITAILNIEEVVEIIKNSSTSAAAAIKLREAFNLSEKQCEAILALKLSRLANLELQKLEKEREEKRKESERIENILNNENLFNIEIKNEIIRIQKEYGDERKTKNISLDFSSKDDDAEPIEEKQLLIYYTNLGNLYTQESTTLLRTRRGTKGSKIKLAQNEVVEEVISDSNLGTLLAFTNKGQMYHISTSELSVNSKINIAQLFELSNEKITALTTVEKNNSNQYYTFITKQGMIKKTSAAEYNSRRGKSIKAINLKDDDEVVSVLFTNEENVGILTNNGNFVIIETNDIAPVGRAAQGIRAIKLSLDDFVIDSKVIKKDDKFVVVVSKNGLIKKTLLSEYPINNRNIKGKRISDIKEGDRIEKFLTLGADCDIIIVSERKTIKISTSEIRELSRAAIGVKSITLDSGDYVKDLRGEANES